MEDLDAATLEDVHAFFRALLRTEQHRATLVGDLTPEEGFAAAERYFGGLPAIAARARRPPQRPLGGPVGVDRPGRAERPDPHRVPAAGRRRPTSLRGHWPSTPSAGWRPPPRAAAGPHRADRRRRPGHAMGCRRCRRSASSSSTSPRHRRRRVEAAVSRSSAASSTRGPLRSRWSPRWPSPSARGYSPREPGGASRPHQPPLCSTGPGLRQHLPRPHPRGDGRAGAGRRAPVAAAGQPRHGRLPGHRRRVRCRACPHRGRRKSAPRPDVSPPQPWAFPEPTDTCSPTASASSSTTCPASTSLSLRVVVPTPLSAEPWPGKEGIGAMTARLLDEGTAAHGSDEFAELMERHGMVLGACLRRRPLVDVDEPQRHLPPRRRWSPRRWPTRSSPTTRCAASCATGSPR